MRASWEEAEQVRSWVYDYLGGHPEGSSFMEIDTALDLGKFRKVDRALQVLRRLGRVEFRKGKWFITPPGKPAVSSLGVGGEG